MNDFIKWLTLCVAVLLTLVAIHKQDQRITVVEGQVYEVCVSMQHLLKNRSIPPIHSYAKPVPVCGEKR